MAYLEATLVADDLPVDAQVIGLAVDDAVSQLYVATVDFETSDPDLDLGAILGKPVGVVVGTGERLPLVVHGQIEDAAYVESREARHLYRIVLAPLIQALAHRVRSRIFQDKSAVEVVAQVLKDAGIPDSTLFWDVDAGSYPKREFCVQYQESELQFVLRLLEDEGIFFWFEHSDSGHVMHLADASGKLPDLPGDPVLTAADKLDASDEHVIDLVITRQVTPDRYRMRDWDLKRPQQPAEAATDLAPSPTIEVYDYPGGFNATAAGPRLARIRGEQEALEARKLSGSSTCLRLGAGRKFSVLGSDAGFDNDYIVHSVRHRFHASSFSSEATDKSSYQSTFEALPGDISMRPIRRTPKPKVFGVESAVVTCPPGEEIHVDDLGRIKVHFFWDREGKIDDKASCWIRVQQQNTTGSVLLPRVGWEMSIAFLDGDPDRPVVLQKLYNRETMPPYTMPANKTQSALQSSTSPGGAGTNEVRLQDGNGGMEFFIHASKDLAVTSGNNTDEDIKVDAHAEVGLALHTKVGIDETVKVGAAASGNVTKDCVDETIGAKKVNVGAMDDWGVTGDFAYTTGGDRSDTIGAMMNVLANQITETYNGSYQRTVGAALSLNTASALVEVVGGSKTELVGGAKMELVVKAKAEQIKGNKMLNSGLITEKIGKDIGVSARAALAITVGGPIAEKIGDSYTLGGKAVAVTAAASADIKAGGSSLSAKGSKLTIKASSLGAAGGPQLKLKGRINYKE
jgi:type VI secretion system secreted protein VgrG